MFTTPQSNRAERATTPGSKTNLGCECDVKKVKVQVRINKIWTLNSSRPRGLAVKSGGSQPGGPEMI